MKWCCNYILCTKEKRVNAFLQLLCVIKVILNGISGEAYNIGNSKPEISVIELFEIIQKIIPNNIQKLNVDYPSTYPTDEPQRRCPDISKAQNHLNFRPTVDIEDGIKRFLTWTNLNYKTEI